MVDRAFGSQRSMHSPLPSWETLKEDENDEESSSGDENDSDEIAPSQSPGSSRPPGVTRRVERPPNTQNRAALQSSRAPRPSANEPSGEGGNAQKADSRAKTIPGMQNVWRAMPPPAQSASQAIATSSNLTQPVSSTAISTSFALSSARPSHPDVTAAPFIRASIARKTPGTHRPKVTSVANPKITPSTSSSAITDPINKISQSQHLDTADGTDPGFSLTRAEAISNMTSSVTEPLPKPEVMKSPKKALARKSTGRKLVVSPQPNSRRRRIEEEEEEEPDFPDTISQSYRKPSDSEKSPQKSIARTPDSLSLRRRDSVEMFSKKPNSHSKSAKARDREAADRSADELFKIPKDFSKAGPSTQPARKNIATRMPPSTQPRPASTSLIEKLKPAASIPATQPNPKKKRRETIALIEISSDEDRPTIFKRRGGRDDPLVISDSSEGSVNNSPPAVRRKPQKSALPKDKLSRRKTLPANLKPLDSVKPLALSSTDIINLIDLADDENGTAPNDIKELESQPTLPISTLQDEHSPSGLSSTFIMPMDIVLNEGDDSHGPDYDVDPVAAIRSGVGDVHISGMSSPAPAELVPLSTPPVSSDDELRQADTASAAQSSKKLSSPYNRDELIQKDGLEEGRSPVLAQTSQNRRSSVIGSKTEEAFLSDDANEVDILLGATPDLAQKADDTGIVETEKKRETPRAVDHTVLEDRGTPRKPQTLTQQLKQLDLSVVANASGLNTGKSSEHGQEQDRAPSATQGRTSAIISSSIAPIAVQSPSIGRSPGPTRNTGSEIMPATASEQNTKSTSPWSAHVTEPERNMFGFYQSTKGRPQPSQESSEGKEALISQANVGPKLVMPTPLRAVENTNIANKSVSSLRQLRSSASPLSSPTNITVGVSDHEVVKHASTPQLLHITPQSSSGEQIKSSETVPKLLRDKPLSPTPSTKKRIPDPLPPRRLRPASPPKESGLTLASALQMPAGTSSDEPVRITTPGINQAIGDSDGETEAREVTRRILKLNPNIFGSSALGSPKSSPIRTEAFPLVDSANSPSAASPRSTKPNSKIVLDRLLGMHAVSSRLNNKVSLQTRDVPAGEHPASGKNPERPPSLSTSLEKETGLETTSKSLQDISEASASGTTASAEKPGVSSPSQTGAIKSIDTKLTPIAGRHGSRKRSRSQSPKPSEDSGKQKYNREVRGLPKRPRILNEDLLDSTNVDTELQELPELVHTSSASWRRSRSRSSASSIDPTDLLDAQTDDGPDSLPEQPHSPVSEITVAVDEITIVSKPASYTPPVDVERYFLERSYGPVYKRAVDIPKELVNEVNDMPAWSRNPDVLRQVFESVIMTNTTHDEPEAPYIRVINNIDDDPTPPFEFYYTNYLWHGEGVPPPDYDSLQGCTCIGKCNPRSKTCACVKRQKEAIIEAGATWDGFAYDKNGHLREHGYPIFECNDACGCTDDCMNRVVQLGRKCHVDIVKTEKKGWGVFAGKKIPKGTFIGIYSGELLVEEEAELRGKVYNKLGRTYLFDVDFYHIPRAEGEESAKYCVDAFHAGNFTRYLNHSCDPNCRINACHINDADVEKALLAMFAERDINAGEELSFSYLGPGNDDDDPAEAKAVAGSPGRKAANSKEKVYQQCFCGARNCSGLLFTYANDSGDEDN